MSQPDPSISAKDLFLEALEFLDRHGSSELIDGEGLDAFLFGRARGDAALIARVKALLDLDRGSERFFEDPARGMPPLMSAPTPGSLEPAEGPGTTIGPYTLIALIGEGGFGRVYLAEQTRPIRRRVALKIIKLGMDTRAVVARFEQERQALAMLEHPSIARVLDAGATETGRPYFVMEYVPGLPITAHCDTHRLSIRDRLGLIVQACRALQHAHTKGIIHRDLKPGNVLVSQSSPGVDDPPLDLPGDHTVRERTPASDDLVKVIDFGIAKAVRGRLAEATVATGLHQLMGTPAYMSPEQAEASPDIDTRTDIYSLGVVLYELLTGTTPFDATQLGSGGESPAGFTPEALRRIREVEPAKPSTRVAGGRASPRTLADVAARRSVGPARLGPSLKGELDWIVMKALDKDRTRRYATAGEFASDIERYLTNQPVLAAPPGRWYRARKFVRRNKGLVVAASLGTLVLTAGAIGTAAGFFRASRQRDLAVAAAARADDEAYAATVNLLASTLDDPYPQASRARSLAAVLDQHPGSWEQRYLHARLDPWLWSTAVAPGNTNSIAVSRATDPPMVVVGSTFEGRGQLTRLDPGDGHILVSRPEHTKPANRPWLQLALAFDRSGQTLLSADNGGRAVFSDPATLEPRAEFDLATPIWVARFSSTLEAFVLATDGSLMALGLDGQRRELVRLGKFPTSLALDDTGTRAIVGYDESDEGVLLVDLVKGTITQGPSHCSITVAEVPGSGHSLCKHIDRAGDLHSAWVVDLADGSVRQRIRVPDQIGSAFAVSPTAGHALYAPPYGNSLRAVTLDSSARVGLVGEHGTGFVFAADFLTETIALSGSTDGSVKAWDTTLERGVRTINATAIFPHALAIDETRRRIGHVGNRAIEWFEIETGRPAGQWDLSDTQGLTTHVEFLPGGQRALTQTLRGEVTLRDARDGRTIHRLLAESGPLARLTILGAVSPDGRLLAGLDRVDAVHLFDADSGAPVRMVRVPAPPGSSSPRPLAARFTPDSKSLVIVAIEPVTGSSVLVLIRVEDGSLEGPIERFTGTIRSMAMHPSGQAVAVGGHDREAWILDLRTRERRPLGGLGSEAILSLAFTPDGQRLIAGIDPREVVVFDAVSGRRLLSLRGPNQTFGLVHVGLLSDGTLVTAGGNRLQVHPIAPLAPSVR